MIFCTKNGQASAHSSGQRALHTVPGQLLGQRWYRYIATSIPTEFFFYQRAERSGSACIEGSVCIWRASSLVATNTRCESTCQTMAFIYPQYTTPPNKHLTDSYTFFLQIAPSLQYAHLRRSVFLLCRKTAHELIQHL